MARKVLTINLFLALMFWVFSSVDQHVFAVLPLQSDSVGNQEDLQNDDTEDITQRQISINFSQNELDSIAANLPDGEVRRMFKEKTSTVIKEDNTTPDNATKKEDEFGHLIFESEKAFSRIQEQILLFFTKPADTMASSEWRVAFDNINSGRGLGHFFMTYFIAALLILAGLAIEWIVRRSTEKLRREILDTAPVGRLHFLGRVLSRLLLNILCLGIFILTTFVLFAFFYDEGDPGYVIILITLILIYYIRLFILTASIVLSPDVSELRFFQLKDEDAKFLYRWIIIIVTVGITISGISHFFKSAGISQEKHLILYCMSGLVVSLLVAVAIWRGRHRVARAIWSGEFTQDRTLLPLRARFATRWHWYASLYVVGIGFFWFIRGLAQGEAAIVPLLVSLFLIPIFIGISYWADHLLDIASGISPTSLDGHKSDDSEDTGNHEPTNLEEEGERKADPKIYLRQHLTLLKRVLRFLLVLLMFFLILRLWGIDLPLGRIFTGTILTNVGLLLLGIVFWQYFKTYIDRKIRKEMPDEDVEMEEGGAGGSRTGTLLVLLRKFILTVLFVIISLIILQSLGVNIGPLILGAGVVGLAIGFGAQTLVTDILSGVFFLIDDAFRVGDFIEAAGVRGTVQHISLRTLKLRHPRGMVFTIPFGELGAVQNFSRDYIITKLDFRVRYDTDVEKVRKTIKKKVYKKLLENEELAPKLLAPIKSQGVRQLDDSAMIMRVKFKTAPGDQFELRKEVFRLMQEAFKAEGIEFAHRNVTVYMPTETAQAGENRNEGAEDRLNKAAAAAALATEQTDTRESKKTE